MIEFNKKGAFGGILAGFARLKGRGSKGTMDSDIDLRIKE